MQGAAHPAKVVIQRLPFEEVGRRSDNIFGKEIIGEQGWITQRPRDFLYFDPPWAADGYLDEYYFNARPDANLLDFMLGSTGPFDLGECDDELFDSFPNILDATGVNGNAFANADQPHTPKVLRDLPDNGRRSPRSALFCSLIQSGILPEVYKLEASEVCQSFESAHAIPRIPCPFVDDEPLSDAQEAESLSEMLQLDGDDYHDRHTGKPKVSYGRMCDMLRDQGAARTLRELYEVDDTSLVESYADEICWDPSVLEELRLTIAQHFAVGESSNSAALHAAINNIEDEYLAEEEEDEAASDLSCSQQRLALEIRRFLSRFYSCIASK